MQPARRAPCAQVMTRVEEDDAIKGAVLISAKPGSWIAGANIKMLEALESDNPEGALERVRLCM